MYYPITGTLIQGMKVRNCIFDHNGDDDTVEGGGIFSSGHADLDIFSSLFYCNEAEDGSAVRIESLEPNTMTNCTVALNHSDVTGAAVSHYLSYSTSGNTIALTNSIVYDNINSSGSGLSAQLSGNVHPEYSCVKNLGSPYVVTLHNITSDPGFVNDTCTENPPCDVQADFRIASTTSPVIDAGIDTSVLDDEYDLLQNAGNDLEPNPDLDISCRIAVRVDMGAYEKGTCCVGNVIDEDDSECRVDVDDLLAVIMNWGLCPAPPDACIGDIAPQPCGDGNVNVDDLLSIITHWGACTTVQGCNCTPGDGSDEIPEDVTDCMNLCSGYTGDEYHECMEKCFIILCENGQTEYCDD